MKNKYFCISLFLLISFSSCGTYFTVEKRKYNSGFYTQISLEQNVTKKSENNSSDSKTEKSKQKERGILPLKQSMSKYDLFEEKKEEHIYNNISADSACLAKGINSEIKIRKKCETTQPIITISEWKPELKKINKDDKPKLDWMSVASLCVAILGLICFGVGLVGANSGLLSYLIIDLFMILWQVFSIFAIIFGAASISRIKNGITEKNITLARIGLIVGIIMFSFFAFITGLSVINNF